VLTELFLRAVILHFVLIVIFGVLLPLRKGLSFPDPSMFSAYACLPHRLRLPDVPLCGVKLSGALSALMIILLRREVHA